MHAGTGVRKRAGGVRGSRIGHVKRQKGFGSNISQSTSHANDLSAAVVESAPVLARNQGGADIETLGARLRMAPAGA